MRSCLRAPLPHGRGSVTSGVSPSGLPPGFCPACACVADSRRPEGRLLSKSKEPRALASGIATLAFLLLGAVAPTALQAATFHYWVEPCTDRETGCHAGDPELAQWALEAWQAATSGKLTFAKAADLEHAEIRVYWANGNQGLYGEARPIMVNGVRGAAVYVLPPADNPQDVLLRETIVYLTCLHETGHALGLQHTAAFADIMYSFQYGGDIPEYFGRYRRLLSVRADIRKHPGMSADDRRRITQLYP